MYESDIWLMPNWKRWLWGVLCEFLRKIWRSVMAPSEHHGYYLQWREAFGKLEEEKKLNGKSPRYWEIWGNEVCPAYRKMSKAYENMGKADSLTDKVLSDMDKPPEQRQYF